MDFSSITDNTIQILVAIGMWLKLRSDFQKEIRNRTDEIKTHTDVSVTRLNGTLKYVIAAMGRPCWVKQAFNENGKTVFRMLELNKEYVEAFGISRQEYIGKTDLEAGWSHEESEKFHKHDLLVWASGEPQDFIEIANGKAQRFRKVCIVGDDGIEKGVMGFTIDCGSPKTCPFYGNDIPKAIQVEDEELF